MLKDQFSYQSEYHCAKTLIETHTGSNEFSYQSEYHCAKTTPHNMVIVQWFSYQSEYHCAKTVAAKSPLQGDVHSTWIENNIRTIEQVNHLFILIDIILN